MKAQILQHVPFEGLGNIERWLSKKKADTRFTRFFEKSASLPDPETIDLVIVLGGPMSVNNEQKHPWLKSEKQFIREVMFREIPIVGVCLGSQLIASSLGARVYNNTEKEIGWFPVEGIETDRDNFHFPKQTTVFHWHGETFDLPEGAIRLASSVACQNQAFQFGPNAIGLQFHLDTTPDTLELMIKNCRYELVKGAFIQTEQEIKSIRKSVYVDIKNLMDNVLCYITQNSK